MLPLVGAHSSHVVGGLLLALLIVGWFGHHAMDILNQIEGECIPLQFEIVQMFVNSGFLCW